MAVILEAAGGSISLGFPEVVRSALQVIWIVGGLNKDEEGLQHVWKSMRASGGIMTLLSLLRVKEPAVHADSIRALACRTLLGLARDATICQILSKMHVASRLLPDLMRDPILVDNINDHNNFKIYAMRLIELITRYFSPFPPFSFFWSGKISLFIF